MEHADVQTCKCSYGFVGNMHKTDNTCPGLSSFREILVAFS